MMTQQYYNIPRNKQAVVFNGYQGKVLKVLTVCTAGCLRSPTAATLLSCEPFNFNTRSCGIDDHIAIVPLTPTLLAWADVILVMEPWMAESVQKDLNLLNEHNNFGFNIKERTLICLDINDNYGYMDAELQKIMLTKFKEIFKYD